MAENNTQMRSCSFCGRSEREAVVLIPSNDGKSYICDSCISVCSMFLEEHFAPEVEHDIEFDLDSPLAPWRGIVFDFSRDDYQLSINEMKLRITFFDRMIDAPVNPVEFKDGLCVLKDGKLFHQSPEPKPKKK